MKHVEKVAERLRAAMPQDPEKVTVEDGKIVIRVCATTAELMASDMEVAQLTHRAWGIKGIGVLRKLVHWWDSNRPDDRLGYDSAHYMGGLIGQARAVIRMFDHTKDIS